MRPSHLLDSDLLHVVVIIANITFKYQTLQSSIPLLWLCTLWHAWPWPHSLLKSYTEHRTQNTDSCSKMNMFFRETQQKWSALPSTHKLSRLHQLLSQQSLYPSGSNIGLTVLYCSCLPCSGHNQIATRWCVREVQSNNQNTVLELPTSRPLAFTLLWFFSPSLQSFDSHSSFACLLKEMHHRSLIIDTLGI